MSCQSSLRTHGTVSFRTSCFLLYFIDFYHWEFHSEHPVFFLMSGDRNRLSQPEFVMKKWDETQLSQLVTEQILKCAEGHPGIFTRSEIHGTRTEVFSSRSKVLFTFYFIHLEGKQTNVYLRPIFSLSFVFFRTTSRFRSCHVLFRSLIGRLPTYLPNQNETK